MNVRQWLESTPNAGMMVYMTLATSLVAVVLLTNWPTYQFEVRGGPIPLWYYALPGVLIVPIIFAEPTAPARLLKEPLLWWFVAYVATGLVWLLFAQNFIDDATQYWRLRVLAFFFFFTIALLASDANRRLIAWVIVGCVLFACAADWIDVLRPHRFVPRGTEDTHSGRGAGLYINPNIAASFIVLGTVAAVPLIPMRFRGLLLLAAIVGIAPTFSRSGFIYAGVVILGAIGLRLITRMQAVIIVGGLILLAAALTAFYDVVLQASDDPNLHIIMRRLSWFEDLEEDDSVVGRRWAAANAWRMFTDNPIVGSGIGATMLQAIGEGPHNMYLTLGAEQGVLGLALYITLVGIIVVRGRRLAQTAATDEGRDIGKAMMVLGAVLAAYGLFSHNVLEEPQTMFVIAFLTAAVFHAPRDVLSSWSVAAPSPLRIGIRPARARPEQP